MTREEAIESLKSIIDTYETLEEKQVNSDVPLDGEDIQALNMAISALKGGWNPLESDEEGMIIGSLPEEGKEVFITVYGQVEIDSFGCDVEYDESVGECRNEWFCENNDIEDVRAWMPLPEPYKKGGEE